ncbi:unnamed protein product [Lactuca virosa]|uniref:Uncharacterized protein n=1 Tax=Lactuca virosa TaxID=75947 RepID=A0AAU9LW70_9ASTR|nr:unnamed protein product [Lactuca virosa]
MQKVCTISRVTTHQSKQLKRRYVSRYKNRFPLRRALESSMKLKVQVGHHPRIIS